MDTPTPTQKPPTPLIGDGLKNPNGPFPDELTGWNWGAFLLTFVWGIGHRVWISLITLVAFIPEDFIPFPVSLIISLVFAAYLGLNGNELAWQHRKFDSIEQFRTVQRAWATWGIALTVLSIVMVVGLIFLLFQAIGDFQETC